MTSKQTTLKTSVKKAVTPELTESQEKAKNRWGSKEVEIIEVNSLIKMEKKDIFSGQVNLW